jgi:hypothetical protein
VSEGVASPPRRLPSLRNLLHLGGAAAEAGSAIAANSGRWIQLTEESAQLVQKFGLMPSKTPGVSHAMIGQPGDISSWLQIVNGPASMLTNPAVLAGAAGIMAQAALQQSMQEITDYLASIDEKVDDILRAQKDKVLAEMIGVQFVIDDAMTVREQVGRVSEVTWSNAQGAAIVVASTQAYALRQLDALAEKLEKKAAIGDVAKAAKYAEGKTQEWLAVLARCFQLQDALGVLELDRVLDVSPDELNDHRIALRAARQRRRERIWQSTEKLIARMDAAAAAANTKVLLHPAASKTVVLSSNHVAAAVVDFHGRLGIESGREVVEARRWTAAALEARNKALDAGAEGLDAAKRLGSQTFGRARVASGRLSGGIADHTRRLKQATGPKIDEELLALEDGSSRPRAAQRATDGQEHGD